jgi:hypothetical protein
VNLAMAASDFTAVNLASIGSIDLISIGSIGSIDLASETDLNIVGSTAVGTERRTIVDRSRSPAGFQKPRRAAAVGDAAHAVTPRRCHHLAPRSRIVKISSHIGSIRIGVPQIRIDSGARSVGAEAC